MGYGTWYGRFGTNPAPSTAEGQWPVTADLHLSSSSFLQRARRKAGLLHSGAGRLRQPHHLVHLHAQPPLWMRQTVLDCKLRVPLPVRAIHGLQIEMAE